MLEGDQLAAFLQNRAGKLTASRMATAMSFKKGGEPTKERSDLMRSILAERMTGDSARSYVTDAMRFGLEMEDEAKRAYEAATGELLGECGTYDHPSIDMFAATPDALISPDGLAEFKVPTSPTFVEWFMAGVVPEMHKPQMAAQMLCSGRKWVEFVAYNPRVRDPRMRLFIRRFEPDAGYLALVEKHAADFLAEVDRAWELLNAEAA
jgi:exodeoxyribonuclease (lambda-induced)